MRSLWAVARFLNYKLEEDQIWSSRIPLTISVDSRPVIDHLNGQVMTIKDKRMAIKILLVKRDVARDNVQVRWLPTDHMLVDGLTKLGVKMDLLRKVLQMNSMRLKTQLYLDGLEKHPRKVDWSLCVFGVCF